MEEEKRRVNILLPEEVINFYKKEANSYSVPYTNYIAMLVIKYYKDRKKENL